ncbi:hypothetical protein SAMN06297468_1181 [Altererythrobacter xiamenensis]|uniref:Peptidase family M48 n=1 Tax=Altererythrobacter xiamenensis TaxID=1316679 RepID=A0A1Y6F6F5_9SPHN|nr:hypothetical protein [Altererythrobacter xiamenensis]SMQ68910.1 hypothetical protein SAMN06297468_1181 [Altererythrobacter xiamenensis]
MGWRVRAGLLALAGAALSTPMVGALANEAEAPVPAMPAELASFHAKDQRLQDIGWQLVTGNAPFCERTQLAVGLQLQDMAVFSEPAAIRSALGLKGDFAVQTVAEGSPAAEHFHANEEVIALDGDAFGAWPAEERNHWQRLARAHDAIDASLAQDGGVTITPLAGAAITLSGVPACASRFELGSGHKRALAEGKRVIFGEDFVGFTFPEEELAAVIAHELSHNLLAHRVWLDTHGRKRKNVRASEREADRLMPWLLTNAGYEPEAALRFMERWGPNHSAGIFRARTHEGWDERAVHIAAEIERVKTHRAPDGSADWKTHFRRELGENGELTPLD